MKKSKFIMVAVCLATILFSSCGGNDGNKTSSSNIPTGAATTSSGNKNANLIGIVNIDTLQANLDMFKAEKAQLEKEQKAVQDLLSAKENKLGQMAQDFQRKMKINAFTSEADAQQQYQELQKLQLEGQNLMQQKTAMLAQKEAQSLQKITQKIREGIKTLNQSGKYKYILDGRVVLDAADSASVDVTKELTQLLNEEYKKNKK